MSDRAPAEPVSPSATAAADLARRVAGLRLLGPDSGALLAGLPALPPAFLPGDGAEAALGLAVHNAGVLRVAGQCLQAFQLLWQAGLMTGVMLPARLLFELWGAAVYVEGIVAALADPARQAWALDKTARLLSSPVVAVPRLGGGADLVPVFHVMDMIRALRRVHPDAAAIYDFLSEGCHPNFLAHSQLWQAGGDPATAARLVRLVDIVETGIASLAEASAKIQQQARDRLARRPGLG